MVARSYLFVPGDRQQMLVKSRSRGADAVIADLEDGVAAGNKEAARETVIEWLATREQGDDSEHWIRFNSGDLFMDDVRALSGSEFDGVILSKVSGLGDLVEAVRMLDAHEVCSKVIPLIETAKGLLACADVADVHGVERLMIGEADLGADLGLVSGHPAWDAIRVQVVVASAAAGLPPPIGPVDPNFADVAGFTSETRQLRSLGFSARAAIHPIQVEAIHTAMAPSAEEVAQAKDLLLAVSELSDVTVGALRGPDGSMVDEAYIRWARRIIDDADRSSSR